MFRTSAFRERTRAQVLDEMAARLGGLAAEEVFLGDRSAGAGGSNGSDVGRLVILGNANFKAVHDGGKPATNKHSR